MLMFALKTISRMHNERASYLGFTAILRFALLFVLRLDQTGIEFSLSAIVDRSAFRCQPKVTDPIVTLSVC